MGCILLPYNSQLSTRDNSAGPCCAPESVPDKVRADRPSDKHLPHFLDGFDQCIHFLSCVVEAERRPCCGGNAESLHDPLWAGGCGGECYFLPVEERSGVVWVHALHHQ